MWVFTAWDNRNAKCIWGKIQRVQKGTNTLSLPVTPLDIDPSLLNMSAFTGLSQQDFEIELDEKTNGCSSSKAWQLISKMSPVRRPFSLKSTNGAILKTSPRPTNLCSKHGMPFPTLIWTWRNMHLESCPSLDQHTYASRFSRAWTT